MNTPQILAINVGGDISGDLNQTLLTQFGERCWSSYSRPLKSGHPRMRPLRKGGEPDFQVIIFDVGLEWSGFDPIGIIDQQIIPSWFEVDVLDIIKDAPVIVLTPETVLMGVMANLKSMRSRRRRPIEFVVREPSGWGKQSLDPAEEILRCLENHRADESSFADYLRKMFSPS
jgi:hypothetical protein